MKRFLIGILGLFLLGQPTIGAKTQAPKKVLMMVSTGFYAPEYFKPRAAFEKAGFEVTVAAKYKIPITPDRRQISKFPPVKPDLTFDQIKVSEYDAIVFSGGNGAWEDFFPNEDVHKVLTTALKINKTVALLCSATGLLGVTNNLNGEGTPIAQGRNVTGYKRVVGLLKKLGKTRYHAGEKGKPFVMVDGNLITGRDPLSSDLFALTIVKKLKK